MAGGLTKAWALPPRPKPGRKPATDTPPSKRKAQNREAQRAFRERRAARVGELEEEIRLRQHDFDREKQEHVAGFEQQRQSLQQDIATWRVRSEHWERLAKEKDAEIAQLRKQVEEASLQLRYTSTSSSASFSAARKWDQPLPSPTTHSLPPILPLPVPHASGRQAELPTPSADCRSCGQGGHCACIEKVLNNLPDPNMAPSPPTSNGPSTAEIKQETDEMEIDFTSKYAAPPTSRWNTNDDTEPIIIDEDETASGRPPGGCGFCTDDSNCVCIQNSRNGPSSPYNMSAAGPDSALASPRHMPDAVPLRRASTKSKPQPLEPASGPGGPGTCPSCVMDPERRRFCQALAAQSNPSTGTKRSAPSPRNASLRHHSTALPSIDATAHLSCSQTYDLLREKLPNFAEKSHNAKFIQQLRTTPPDRGEARQPAASSTYDVEAASVLSVLAHARGGSYLDGHSNVAKRRR